MKLVPEALTNLFSPVTSSFSAVQTKVTEIVDELAALQPERTDLLRRSTMVADARATVPAAIDAYAAEVRHRLGPELLAKATGGLAWDPSGQITRVPPAVAELSQVPAFDLLVLFCRDQVVNELIALAPTTGPSIEERLRRLAEIDRRRPTLERAHEAIVDRAQELGFTLPHLPATIQRRQLETQRLEREAHARADAEFHVRLSGR